MGFGCEDSGCEHEHHIDKQELNFTTPLESNVQPSRVHHTGDYQHKHTAAQLTELLSKYLDEKLHQESEILEWILSEIDEKKYGFPERVYSQLKEVTKYYKTFPVIYNAILKNLAATQDDFDISLLVKIDDDSVNQLKAELSTSNEYLKIDLYEKAVSGEITLCYAAYYSIIDAMHKTVKEAHEYLTKLGDPADKVTSNLFASYLFRHAFTWKLLCRAFETDDEDIFYSDANSEDIEILEKHCQSVEPKDLKVHQTKLDEYILKETNVFGGLELAFSQPVTDPQAKVGELIAAMTNPPELPPRFIESYGRLFQSCVSKDCLRNSVNFVETPEGQAVFKSLVQEQIGLDEIFYIKMSEDDHFTLDNIMDPAQPKMVTEHLDMPIHTDYSAYDKDTHLRVEVISHEDWGRVDWTTGQLIDPEAEPVEYDTIVVYIHGGGWVVGNTIDYQWTLRRASNELKAPVFSLEYRLAPENPFPTANSDCLQGYLWLKEYAQEHLGIKFNKMVIWGESAGGNLVTSLPLLCLTKNVPTPDGVVAMFPVSDVDVTKFNPSVLCGLDETLLNSYLMEFFSKSFVGKLGFSNNYIMNPFEAPTEAYQKDGEMKYPPIRFIISGQDQLRDATLKLIIKLAKAGVDVNAINYMHQYHGFIPGTTIDTTFDEKDAACHDIINFITEMTS